MLREKPAHLNAPSPGGSATGLAAIPRHGSSRWPSRRTEMQVSCMSPAVQKGPLGDLHATGPSPREERVEGTPRRLTQGATARLGDLALLRSILLSLRARQCPKQVYPMLTRYSYCLCFRDVLVAGGRTYDPLIRFLTSKQTELMRAPNSSQ